MKFRFRPSIDELDLKSINSNRRAILKGRNTLRLKSCKKLARNYLAEDFGTFEKPSKKLSGKRILGIFKSILNRIRENKKRYSKKSRISPITMFGAFCGAVCVAVISAAVVIFSLFGGHWGSYTEISVPNLVSMSEQDATSYRTDLFEYTVVYKSNPSVSSNVVTAQSPLPDITRKLYGKGEKVKITLTVNTKQTAFTLPRVVGTPLRDTLILLKQANINTNVIKQYSSSVPYGRIIYSSVPEDTVMKEGDSVTLRVSLGKEVRICTVPDLIGMNEYQATDKLCTSGLKLGDITYQASKSPIGTVISQSVDEGTSLTENSKVSFVLSGGIYYQN